MAESDQAMQVTYIFFGTREAMWEQFRLDPDVTLLHVPQDHPLHDRYEGDCVVARKVSDWNYAATVVDPGIDYYAAGEIGTFGVPTVTSDDLRKLLNLVQSVDDLPLQGLV